MPVRAGTSDVVEQRQNEQPDDIHEVPVKGDIVQGDVAGRREAAREELAQEAPDDEQDTNSHMQTVKASDEKELEP
jgi:hypothetical protein